MSIHRVFVQEAVLSGLALAPEHTSLCRVKAMKVCPGLPGNSLALPAAASAKQIRTPCGGLSWSLLSGVEVATHTSRPMRREPLRAQAAGTAPYSAVATTAKRRIRCTTNCTRVLVCWLTRCALQGDMRHIVETHASPTCVLAN